jgi:Uma2 family endonuclease
VREAQRLFTVEEYYRMAEVGIFHEDDRVELIEGKIIQMAAIGSRRAACVKRLNKLLVQEVGDSGIVGAQDPVILPDISEPEPDLTVLRPRDDFYAAGHPVPEDVLLLIEVSDTLLDYDRDVKVPLPAQAGIPEAWVMDLANEKTHVCSQPTDGFYRDTRSSGRSGSVSPQALLNLMVSVEDALG